MKLTPTDRAWTDKALHAIEAVAAGPSDADIAAAPVLSNWKPAVSPFGYVILVGDVVDHPILGNASITTSHLIAIRPEARWARTVSRWYRLAQPHSASDDIFAKHLGLKNPTPAAIRFSIPGFLTLDDMLNLEEILAVNITRIRQIDAADRAASEREG